MTTQELVTQINKKKSFLCIGLDVDLTKIPTHLLKEEDPIFAFNKAIIDATHHLCVSYKPNTAFYEAYGIKGWKSLEKTIKYLNEKHPEIFTIADAKRGDIGNTSTMYAKAFFEDLAFDSVTVAPYMGKDSVEPFLAFDDKHTIMLALTSNQGAFDFQTKMVGETDRKEVYKQVLETSKDWKNSENLMYVVGATKAEYFTEIRKIVPDSFLLVPGVGAQGGNLQDVCKYGMTKNVGLLINSSRGIIYASDKEDFAEAAAKNAEVLQEQMKDILNTL
ncbi:orotidine-5'-phosphate decarboxylase [Tenacibaculum finnmarkense]|uniref:Orotidine 5'-phosphate decarboxylase n=1 Tax=Tenacibaculum finnmarkense genomovar finnmarkense TaxID=1458503 RepID=A0AAP1RE33_9FLAO|nr:orotidine-5'-phosphate decarboxylase [Tenacibaculum finnmarkense]MBE7652209.1 orotidine-5'-phosphate decarboxylase [Tenacibaculum finnmarkense genomovar finnmarkense]MBE7659257.1 orotidine-5'-phosphate decarboxylase [Tenacibaculum finnmarkense genomovar finnmarkense]MBE7694619.1 orotidine-5'-phosphate decarboxylase [Tenacibaculum finnmarkense genomovar finnmarkense]MCD8412530.1 orotidine-5'-phosphate decarboxylase [Tenacibaculum finnmarkense genomovar ulcerans]MCD8426807.1 orotidine-5'-phos